MELGLLRDFLGIFPHEVKDIIFHVVGALEVRLNPHEVRLKQTLNIVENLEKLTIMFWVGTFGDYI